MKNRIIPVLLIVLILGLKAFVYQYGVRESDDLGEWIGTMVGIEILHMVIFFLRLDEFSDDDPSSYSLVMPLTSIPLLLLTLFIYLPVTAKADAEHRKRKNKEQS